MLSGCQGEGKGYLHRIFEACFHHFRCVGDRAKLVLIALLCGTSQNHDARAWVTGRRALEKHSKETAVACNSSAGQLSVGIRNCCKLVPWKRELVIVTRYDTDSVECLLFLEQRELLVDSRFRGSNDYIITEGRCKRVVLLLATPEPGLCCRGTHEALQETCTFRQADRKSPPLFVRFRRLVMIKQSSKNWTKTQNRRSTSTLGWDVSPRGPWGRGRPPP